MRTRVTLVAVGLFALMLAAPLSASATTYSPVSWGLNDFGQLGDGTETNSDVPVEVSGLKKEVVAIASGGFHSLALRKDGTVVAWGRSDLGQLGDGTEYGYFPVEVSGLKEVVAIAGGEEHSLALRKDGTVVAWGRGDLGQLGVGLLGNGFGTHSDVPLEVKGLKEVVAIAGGGSDSLALRKDGTVVAWGRNDLGQLGDGTKTGPPYCDLLVPCSRVPVEVNGLKEVVAIAGGEGHDLALRKDGTVVAWGRNDFGQLGDGTETNSDVPVEVSGLKEVVAIAGGGFHDLALRKDGTVVAWGRNDFGQLGDGTETGPNYCVGGPCSEVPVEVEGLKEVVAIAGGGFHSLALRKDGTVVAWGRNDTGQLGVGNESNSGVPVEVSGLKEVVAIAGGEGHSLALAPAPADLSLENSALPSSVLSGKTLTYTLTVTNSGGETASEVKLKDQLPESSVFKSLHTTQGTCTRSTTTNPKTKGGTVSCNLGSLEGGKTATITITVTRTKPGTLNAKATVSASNVTSDTDDEATTTTALGD